MEKLTSILLARRLRHSFPTEGAETVPCTRGSLHELDGAAAEVVDSCSDRARLLAGSRALQEPMVAD